MWPDQRQLRFLVLGVVSLLPAEALSLEGDTVLAALLSPQG